MESVEEEVTGDALVASAPVVAASPELADIPVETGSVQTAAAVVAIDGDPVVLMEAEVA